MKYCLYCGFVGEPGQKTPGTVSTEVGLWLFFVVPGLLYSVWRRLARQQRCAKCGNTHIVAAESPVAQAALLKLSPTSSLDLWFCMGCGEPIFSAGFFCQKCSTRSSRASAPEALLRA